MLFKGEHRKIIILSIFLGMIVSYFFVHWNTDYYLLRSGDVKEETYRISNEHSIIQDMYVGRNSYIRISCFKENIKKNDKLVFTLSQDDITEKYVYDANKLRGNTWDVLSVDMDFDDFLPGIGQLQITFEGEGDGITVLLVENPDEKVLQPAILENGISDNKYLDFMYDKYNPSYFVPLWFISTIIIGFLLYGRKYFSQALRTYPITVVAFFVVFYWIAIKDFYVWTHIEEWVRAFWMIDYRFGFTNRGFVGSIVSVCLKLFNGNTYLSDNTLRGMIIASTLIVSAVVLHGIYLLEKYANANQDKLIKGFMLIFVLNPFFFTYYLNTKSLDYSALLGRVDIFLIMLSIIVFELLLKRKYLYFIPICIFIGICIYHIYAITFVPVILSLLLIAYCDSKEKKVKNILVVSIVIWVGLTIYMSSFAHVHGIPMDEYFKLQAARTDVDLKYDVTTFYGYGHEGSAFPDIVKNHLWYRLFLLVMFTLPFWGIYLYIVYNRICISNSLLEKFAYASFLGSGLFLFTAIQSSDFMRYFADWYMGLAYGFFVLYFSDSYGMKDCSEQLDVKLQSKIGRYYLSMIIAYGYLLGIAASSWPFATSIDCVVKYTNYLNNFIKSMLSS